MFRFGAFALLSVNFNVHLIDRLSECGNLSYIIEIAVSCLKTPQAGDYPFSVCITQHIRKK